MLRWLTIGVMKLRREYGRTKHRHGRMSMGRSKGGPHFHSCFPLRLEWLEDRTLLNVAFNAGPLDVPAINTPDLRLGNPSNFTLIEPMVSVSRTDPINIAVSTGNGLRLSTNGGATAAATVTFPLVAGATGSNGDTDTAFDAQGRLFWTNLQFVGGVGDVGVAQINPTNGAQVGTSSNVNRPNDPNFAGDDDKAFLVADTNLGGAHQDNLYVVWTKFQLGGSGCGTRVMFARSEDDGVNWFAPLELSDGNGADDNCGTADDEGFVWPSDVAVAPNGDVYAAYHSSQVGGRTFVLRSTDGGVTFPQKTTAFLAGASDIAFNVQDNLLIGRIAGAQFWTQGSAQPFVIADPSRPGNVYVVTADDPDAHGSGDDANVVIARSTNNGLTWTNATISSGPNNSFQVFPTAAIDRFGTMLVAWYDNRRFQTNANENYLLDVYVTYSVDGGLTWSPEFRVNDLDNVFDPDAGAPRRFPSNAPTCNASPNSNETCRIGEYFGLDVFANTAYVAWNCNTFSGGLVPEPIGQQVCFDTFAINGTVTVTGDEAGAATNDTIALQPIAGNAGFIQVSVNGQRRYAGIAGNVVLDGLAGDDTITNSSAFAANILGNAGNDTIMGGTGADTIDGGVGDDNLNGGDGFDQVSIVANTLNVSITVTALQSTGVGSDTLAAFESVSIIGSSGNDTLTNNSTLSSTINGGPGDDVLQGGTGSDQVRIEAATLNVAITVNAAATQSIGVGIDSLSGFESIAIVGSSGNDTITNSSSLAATINGGAGDDILQGGTGTDQVKIEASTLNATLSVNTTASQSTGAGTDTLGGFESIAILGSVGNDIITNNSNLPATLAGSAGDDAITGGSAGESLSGGTGGDTLAGGQANDTLVGGADDDRYVFTAAAAVSLGADTIDDIGGTSDSLEFGGFNPGAGNGITVNLGTGSFMDNTASGPFLTLTIAAGAIENVTGTDRADNLTGSSVANILTGRSGNDALVGSTGDDRYVFTAAPGVNLGTDTVTEPGGGTADIFDFGNFNPGTGSGITIDLGAGTFTDNTTSGPFLNLSFTGAAIEIVTGTDRADNLIGSNAANTLIGGAGNDALAGGQANDNLVGGGENDRYVFTAATGLNLGTDTIDETGGGTADSFDFSGFNPGAGNGITINLGAATFADNTAGGPFVGLSFVAAAIESLRGTNRADNMIGSNVANTLIGGAGIDTLDGGDGVDTASYEFAAAAVVVNLKNGRATIDGDGGNDGLSSIESLVGSSRDDNLTGSKANDTISGGSGRDTINGSGGNDSLVGDDQDDSISGAKGNDTLVGGQGLGDVLNGGKGMDNCSDIDGAREIKCEV